MNEDLKYWICLDLDKRYTLKTKLEHLEKEKNIIKVCEKLHINLNVNFNKYIEYMQKNNIYCIPISYKEYPKNLRRLRYPPIIIYAKGNYSLLNEKKMIAVIGARNCSNYGKEIAKKIGKYLAENNINVVSGLAMGIDVFSHIGCINENITNKKVKFYSLNIYDYLAILWLDMLETYRNFRRSEFILRFGDKEKRIKNFKN